MLYCIFCVPLGDCRDRTSTDACQTSSDLCWFGTADQQSYMNLYCTKTCEQCEMPFCKKGTELTREGECVGEYLAYMVVA